MGESNVRVIVLSALLVLALAGLGFLYWQHQVAVADASSFQQAYTKASLQLEEFNKVIIAADGTISYPQANRLYVYGFGTYAYVLEDLESAIGIPEPVGEQSAFNLCYTLEQTGTTLTIRLKNAYSDEFYKHCEGNYRFPVLVNDEPFSAFELHIIPGPAS